MINSLFLFVLFFNFAKASSLDTQSKTSVVKNSEIQWVFCNESTFSISASLKLKTISTEKRSVYYFDTRNLELNDQNIVLRFRVENEKIKSSLKKNYSKFSEIPEEVLSNSNISKCEWDIYTDKEKIGCSLNEKYLSPVTNLLLSGHQKEYFKRLTSLNLNSLIQFGPIQETENLTVSSNDEEFTMTQTIEPSGNVVIKLSIRVPLENQYEVQNYWGNKISQGKLQLCDKQSGRIRIALEQLNTH